MSDIAEQYDYWNDQTGISIGQLEVLKVVAKAAKNPDEVNVGQLFTAIAHMTTQNDEDVEVCLTGYLRGVMEKDSPRPWVAKDCYAPRNHQNGVPPVRLLKYPRNLRAGTGDRLLTIDLSKLIADQLANDGGWREQICEKVDQVSMEAIYASLGLEPPQPAAQEPEPHSEEIGFDGIAESAQAEETEVADQKIDLDGLELDEEDQDILQVSSVAEAQTNAEAERIDLDVESGEDADDVASLVDEWDEEDADDDLAALDGQASQSLESLSNLDDDSGITDHNPERVEAFNRSEEVAEKFDWANDQSVSESATEDAPVLTEEAETVPENASPTIDFDEPEQVEKPAPVKPQPEPAPIQPAPEKPTLHPHQNVHQFAHQEKRAAVQVETQTNTPSVAMSKDNEKHPESKVAREHVLFNTNGYDVGFLGFEHGQLSVKDDTGELGTLFTTRGGLIVVHVDGTNVVEVKGVEKEKLFSILGYDREAKKAYQSANIDCVRWLE